MKILLVFPRTKKKSLVDSLWVGEPLALEYVAAGLDTCHEIKLLDMRFNSGFTKTVEEFAPDVIGFTGYTYHVNVVKKLSQEVKRLNPEITVVVGGHHATISPKDYYIPSIDIVVRGEGIYTFNEIVRRIGKNESLSELKGISVNVDGTFKENTFTPLTDFDSAPLPDRSLKNKAELAYGSVNMSFLVTSQGCAYKCKFCSCWEVTGGKYIPRDLSSIIEEIKSLNEYYITFADDESFLIPQRMIKFAELIDQAGIKKRYYASIRVDTVCNNPQMLQMWKDIGLSGVFIGLETFKQDDLNFYNKKTKLDENIKALNILKEIGIPVFAGFIIRQDYDEEDFDNLAQHVHTLPVDLVAFGILTPLPHTQLFREQEHNLISRNYDLFDYNHTVLPTKLPLKNFYREVYHLNIRTFKINMKGTPHFFPEIEYNAPVEFKEDLLNLKYAYLDHE